MAVGKSIVVVDDDPSVRLLVSRVLQKAGYEVTAFSSGEDAIAHLEAKSADLLITDRLLPRLSGVELIHRTRERHPAIPVILITGAPEHHALSQERVDVYLPKPFKSLKVLEDAVARALQMGETLKQRVDAQKKLADLMVQLKPKADSTK